MTGGRTADAWQRRDRTAIHEVLGRIQGLQGAATPAQITGASRGRRETALRRHMVMYLLHVEWQWPQSRIARAFGRDRAGIRYAIRRIENLRDDPRFDWLMARWEQGFHLLGELGGRLGGTLQPGDPRRPPTQISA